MSSRCTLFTCGRRACDLSMSERSPRLPPVGGPPERSPPPLYICLNGTNASAGPGCSRADCSLSSSPGLGAPEEATAPLYSPQHEWQYRRLSLSSMWPRRCRSHGAAAYCGQAETTPGGCHPASSRRRNHRSMACRRRAARLVVCCPCSHRRKSAERAGYATSAPSRGSQATVNASRPSTHHACGTRFAGAVAVLAASHQAKQWRGRRGSSASKAEKATKEAMGSMRAAMSTAVMRRMSPAESRPYGRPPCPPAV
eukprot:scaffold236539_cov33-Tisochrysis_lutea.AAC.4